MIPSADVSDLQRATPVHHAQCVVGGLQILGLHGESECLAGEMVYTFQPWKTWPLLLAITLPRDEPRFARLPKSPTSETSTLDPQSARHAER